MKTSAGFHFADAMRFLLVGLLFTDLTVSLRADPSQRFTSDQRLNAAYGKLPLSFEVNDGQTDARVKFLSRGRSYSLFLTNDEAVLALSKSRDGQGASLRMKLLGANAEPKVTGCDKLPGVVNYYIGNDPAKWRAGIATYAKVRFEKVYPGVDLVYYGNQRQLEYDYIVAPGANPKCIRLGFDDAEKLHVDEQGNLLVETASGAVRWHKPVVYQQVRGKRKTIAGNYVLHYGNEVSFQIAKYDASKPLVIDPSMAYSTFLGGSGDETASGGEDGPGIAVDKFGHAVVAGSTASTDFPASGFQTNDEGVIAELNVAGTALIYATYFGPKATIAGVAVDTDANAYIAGEAHPGTPGTILSGSSADGPYVAKFDTTGALVYSGLVGGGGAGNAVAVASDRTAYVAGHDGNDNVIVARISADGTGLLFTNSFGGSASQDASGIAVDTNGNAYVTGATQSTNFPTTTGAFQTTNPNGGNNGTAFVTKLNNTGQTVYSTYLGGSNGDQGIGIAVNSAGEAYVAGSTNSSDFPTTTGAFQTVFSTGGPFSGSNGFVTKLTVDGTAQVYSTFLGGSNYNQCEAIAVDAAGDAYVTGITGSTDFPIMDAFQSKAGDTIGADDAFVTEFTPDGSALVYSSYLGGSDGDDGYGIAVDPTGTAYVVGGTRSTDFPITPHVFQTANTGGKDFFVTKINPVLGRFIAAEAGPPAIDAAAEIAYRVVPTGSRNAEILLFSGTTPTVVAQVGGTDTVTGATFTKLSDPVLSGSGVLAFLGTLKPGTGDATSHNDIAVYLFQSGSTRIVSRVGDNVPGANPGSATITGFAQIAVDQAGGIALLAKIKGSANFVANGFGFFGTDNSGALTLLDRMGGSTKKIIAFKPLPDVIGQSRSIDTINGNVVYLRLDAGNSGVIVLGNPQTHSFSTKIPITTGQSPASFGGATVKSLGEPTVNANGNIAFSAVLSGNGINGSNKSAIALTSGTTLKIAERTGNAAPDSDGNATGAVFSKLSDPVLNNNDRIAFVGTLKNGGGVNATNDLGIWSDADGTLKLIVRKGDNASGGGKFSAFNQIVLPDVGGVIIFATLSGVPAVQNQGVWIVGSNGIPTPIVRKGDMLNFQGTLKKVKKIGIFELAPSVTGQTRSFDAVIGNLVFRATFTDGTIGIYKIDSLP